MTFMLILFLCGIFLLAGAFVALRRVLVPTAVTECDPSWIGEFSIQRYRPMLRLLDETDFSYLANHDSCSGKTLKGLRQKRRQIFRSYLRNLTSDFNRLHLAARLMTLYSQQDRPELAAALLRQKLVFSLALVTIECQLTLHAIGMRHVNVAGLLNTVDSMRGQLSNLTATAPVLG